MNEILQGDCLQVMKTFPSNHFTNILTDPPYGLKFMGKGWDYEIPSLDYWKEGLRVCKPGAYMLCFGGTRTYHRLACAIEDAGWVIRDCIMWIYGTGFPKSHNNFGLEGYGTALKPAYEPIIMAMKPLEGTFKENVEKWGLGGINIDGCRIGKTRPVSHHDPNKFTKWKEMDGTPRCESNIPDLETNKGRWPSNVILDDEAGKMLDGQVGISGGASRYFYCAKASPSERNEGLSAFQDIECKTGCGGDMPIDDEGKERNRFKKISKNPHPTVKPLKLIKYLLTLIAPPHNGLVLDPFVGSGTTLVAAKQLGIKGVGIEREKEYVDIAKARVSSYEKPPEQLDLLQNIN